MSSNRILITVKTYPTISKTHNELVCTAGFTEEGEWVRLYPVPFRKLEEKKYKKYQWMNVVLDKNKKDPRPESHCPRLDTISLGDTIGTEQSWERRKQIVFKKVPVFTNLDELIGKANNNELSLATFKPTEILDFIVEEDDPDWDKDTLAELQERAKQNDLFEEDIKELKLVEKIPFKFSYRFKDNVGKESKLMILDWEIGMLYLNTLKKANNNKGEAIKKVRHKYFDTFVKNSDLHFFLGTTRQFHGWANNPFVIVGLFTPPAILQESLF